MQLNGVECIIGGSRAIQAVREEILRIAPKAMPVLISGPTGTGKELVARALHFHGGRGGRFVSVNVCAVAGTMFEAAFFGHVRGAFTGAVSTYSGFMAEAACGTLFLDEIASMAIHNQDKLLRALQTRTFRPVGGREDRFSDFRVIAATNRHLEALIHAEKFRIDLYYRLKGQVIDLPPLRERIQDVIPLARHFAARAEDGPYDLAKPALELLLDHAWPGNIRELEQVVHSAALWTDGPLIGPEAVLKAFGPRAAQVVVDPERDSEERRALLEVLQLFDWNTAAVAKNSGVDRGTIYRWMRRLHIPTPRRRGFVRRLVAEANGKL